MTSKLNGSFSRQQGRVSSWLKTPRYIVRQHYLGSRTQRTCKTQSASPAWIVVLDDQVATAGTKDDLRYPCIWTITSRSTSLFPGRPDFSYFRMAQVAHICAQIWPTDYSNWYCNSSCGMFKADPSKNKYVNFSQLLAISYMMLSRICLIRHLDHNQQSYLYPYKSSTNLTRRGHTSWGEGGRICSIWTSFIIRSGPS